MKSALKDLAQCGDVGSLKSALLTVCSEFGSLSQLDIMTVTGEGKRKAVCLLRLDSPDRDQDLISKLGAIRFGDEICVVVDMGMQNQAQA